MSPVKADATFRIEPSILSALPHYLPLAVFPLIILASIHGGWWLVPPLVFMSVAGMLDRALGPDGRSMDPFGTPEKRLIWHNLPVWGWAFLWPPTLIFGMWQILVADQFAIWEDVLLVIILTMEAQAIFVVGHELIHRRTSWERKMGEFLLACASYPQYATEHVYIHHAKVGTPHDAGSAPMGESFWKYFPKEVVCNLTNSWQVARERLARRRLPVWHYSNPFWRYGLTVAFWYGLAFWMGGIWAVPVFAFLGLCCVFSMKISNYFQHYGLRRVRLQNGRWEKVLPRHSWSADWKFSNWMFFNMQRHADHHAAASRHYPLLQVNSRDESPELPGTYADMMNIVLRPKRWFEKMDPLVDQWRGHFYPEIDDWSAYDSPVSARRPDAIDAIIEIFAAAPRLAKWIERNSELLDNLQEREFTDLELPKGLGLDAEHEAVARRGLARLYWTHEMGVQEMKELIAELPTADARETAEIVRNWSNDRAFQIGMHVVRGNLVPNEAKTALSNLAEASISTVLSAVVADFAERSGSLHECGVAAVALGDLASREVFPGAPVELLFVHDGEVLRDKRRLFGRFRKSLAELAVGNLLFSPMPAGSRLPAAVPFAGLAEQCDRMVSDGIPALARARCIFECGDTEVGHRFGEARSDIFRNFMKKESASDRLRELPKTDVDVGVATFARMRGGLADVERAARFMQLTGNQAAFHDPAPSATAVFEAVGNEHLAHAAAMWRDLQGILCLIGGCGFDPATASATVRMTVATASGHEDFDALASSVADVAAEATSQIDTLLSRT